MIHYYQYSFYSETKKAFAQVKATCKENVLIYAKEIMQEEIEKSKVSKINKINGEQSPVELSYPELFSK